VLEKSMMGITLWREFGNPSDAEPSRGIKTLQKIRVMGQKHRESPRLPRWADKAVHAGTPEFRFKEPLLAVDNCNFDANDPRYVIFDTCVLGVKLSRWNTVEFCAPPLEI